jgi:hypothetical protein
MDHNDVRHKLSEYIDGSMTDQEKTAIEEHLRTCSACGDALTEFRKTIEHVKTIEEVEPPAWITHKIMAKVRAEAEEKKSLFQRFFYPLSVKLPIQAAAVLFLTITAFYIYRDIQPAPAPSEGPIQEHAAKKEAPQAAAPVKEQTISPGPPARSQKVPQSPEYKSLDMKYEYEKPAPPVALGKAAESAHAAAPAPAKPEEQPKPRDESFRGESGAKTPAGESIGNTDKALEESGRTLRQERTEPSAGLLSAGKKAKTASPAPQARAMTTIEEPKKIKLSLSASDTARAAQDIEKIVTQLGGRVVEKAGDANTPTITVSLDSDKLKELNAKLRSVGELKDKEMLSLDQRGILQIEFVILKTSLQP